jgi:hypothetical protein
MNLFKRSAGWAWSVTLTFVQRRLDELIAVMLAMLLRYGSCVIHLRAETVKRMRISCAPTRPHVAACIAVDRKTFPSCLSPTLALPGMWWESLFNDHRKELKGAGN